MIDGKLKKIIVIIVIICSFSAVFLYFGGDVKKLIYLKNNGEKITAQIIGIEKANPSRGKGRLELSLSFEYENQQYTKKITVKKGMFINSSLSDYQLGKKIRLLVDKEKWLIRPENTIKKEIINKIILLISLPLIISYFMIMFIFYLKNKFENLFFRKDKILYEYYFQDNKHKIHVKNRESDIRKKCISELIDFNKIKSGEIICYGIGRGKYFVELSYENNEYYVRIFFGEEKEEVLDNSEDIINEYYNLAKNYLGSGV
ncbi:MAG: hypothetical protein LBI28_00150 [Treponema sp.]|jgi:hypothetical protein|nr:hypothetical protein [Treponema sp.]